MVKHYGHFQHVMLEEEELSFLLINGDDFGAIGQHNTLGDEAFLSP